MQRFVLTLYFFLVFYLVGELVMENEVNYRTWQWIGADEFPLYHQELERLLQPFMMAPLTLLVVLSWIMVWQRNSKNIRILFLTNALLFSAFTIISLLVMVPVHNQLSQEYNAELIQYLIKYNSLFRSPIVLAVSIINLYLLVIFLFHN